MSNGGLCLTSPRTTTTWWPNFEVITGAGWRQPSGEVSGAYARADDIMIVRLSAGQQHLAARTDSTEYLTIFGGCWMTCWG